MKKHYREIDILRGIAICMVLLYHSVIVFPINLHEIAWCKTLHSFLWCLEMPLFFLVSGFCFSYTGGYGGYLSKKIKRLLVPHVVFALLDILPRIIPNPLVNKQLDAVELLKEFVLYGGSDWFLWVLFLILLCFPAAELFCRRVKRGPAVLLAGSLLLYFMSPRLPDLLLFNMAAEYTVYFYIGYFIRRLGYDTFKAGLLNGVTAAVCAAVTGGAFIWTLSDGESMAAPLLTALAGCLFFWRAAAALSGGRFRTADHFLNACGRYSLQMYLLGGYALVASRTALVMLLHITLPAAVIVCNFAADAAVTLAASKFVLERFRPLRIISGLPWEGKST